MFPHDLLTLAESVLNACRQRGLKIAAAESCTGGLLTACLTHIPGSSDVVERGFVTYSNEAKTELLGVSADLITRAGAVSAEVAEAMAAGALARSRADLAVSITGIAGPGGGTSDKPVGLIYIGMARRENAPHHQRYVFSGDRSDVRQASVKKALKILESMAWNNA